MNELNETKNIADILQKYSSKSGHDVITTWNDWLEWCCKVFEWEAIDKAGGFSQRFVECKDENPLFFDAMKEWLELANKKMSMNNAYDAFGTLYEANYQSSFKASSSGQFFTPMSICEVMAKITTDSNNKCMNPTDEVVTFNDCACGSGRTLLAAWERCEKFNRNLFYAGDLDSTSVYMCALNFLVHGIVGMVEKRDALTQEWYFGFVVNGCKVPFMNEGCCLQYFDDEKAFKKALRGLYGNAKIWNITSYRPREEVQENKKREKKKPVQLSLFD